MHRHSRQAQIFFVFFFLPFTATIRPFMATIRPILDLSARRAASSPSTFDHIFCTEHMHPASLRKRTRMSVEARMVRKHEKKASFSRSKSGMSGTPPGAAFQADGSRFSILDTRREIRLCLRGGSQAPILRAPASANGLPARLLSNPEASESEHSSENSALSRCPPPPPRPPPRPPPHPRRPPAAPRGPAPRRPPPRRAATRRSSS